MFPGMAKPAFASHGHCKIIYQIQCCFFCFGKNYLCNTVAVADGMGFAAEIYQYHFQFAPVIAVNGAGAVKAGNAVVNGQPASWPHLCFVAFR